MTIKKFFTLAACFILTAFAAQAQPWYTDEGGLFSKGTGAVIDGYDTVAYFTSKTPTKGLPEFSSTYQDGVFYFSSAANKAKFDKKPEQYIPQYGGYCAYAAAKNKLVETDATVWEIIDGKLYLNYSESVKEDWLKDTAGYIKAADTNWPTLKNKR